MMDCNIARKEQVQQYMSKQQKAEFKSLNRRESQNSVLSTDKLNFQTAIIRKDMSVKLHNRMRSEISVKMSMSSLLSLSKP